MFVIEGNCGGCKSARGGNQTETAQRVGADGVVVFVPIRRAKVKAQPEEVLAWLRAKELQPDGRIHVRMSEYCAHFGIEQIKRAETFYYVLNALAQRGIIDLERWRLEKFGDRPKVGQKFKPSWHQDEVVYVLTPIAPAVRISFDTYVDPTDTFPPLTKEERVRLWAQAEGRCAYCHKELTIQSLVCDHKQPRGRGGKHVWSNFAAACTPCNNDKQALTPDEFRLKLARTTKREAVRA